MTNIHHAWGLTKYWQNPQGVVTIVEAQAVFTSSDFPGVSSIHSARVDISGANITDGSDEDAIISALEIAMAPTFEGADPLHYEQLRYEYNVANAAQETPLVAPDENAVTVERNRRISVGFTFNGKLYNFDDRSKANISGATQLAFMAIVAGAQPGDLQWNGSTDFAWIAADNSLTTMDAQTVVAFGQAAAAHEQAHIFAARTLKDSDPIPGDFATNESYWP